MSGRLTIDAMGDQGDGIAKGEAGPIFVPFTLPGESVNASVIGQRADLISILEPSNERVAPLCRHFGECGGCALQHWEPAAYRQWKRERLVDALARRGLFAEIAPLVACPPASRRRVALACRKTEAGMLLGFHAALSDRIVAIEKCPIADPAIAEALPLLRELAAMVAPGTAAFSMTVTITGTGLDIALSGLGKSADGVRRAASDFALRSRFARLAHEREIWIEPVKPTVRFGGISVVPPSGAFLQAVAESEAAMVDLVLGHLKKAKKAADLFAGIGTFALRLAQRSKVHAVEADGGALAALDRAVRHAEGLKPLTTERRDLFERPLTWKELKAFDAVVFDPPRAGAEEQCRQLVRSDVPTIAAISCNPVTLARDLSILVEGGYAIRSVTPIDQFLFSPHLEAVALLSKPARRR